MPDNITYTDPTVGTIPNVGIGSATMNRWLKLFNTQVVNKIFSYIPIYAYTGANNIFQINAQYNFQINNNFTLSITELNDLLAGVTCTVCIRYNILNADGSVTVYRFKLNDPIKYKNLYTFEPVPYPMYNGEVIPKNFSIEIFSNNDQDAVVTLPAEIDITTSLFNTTQDSFDPTNNTVIPPQKLADSIVNLTVPSFDMISIPFTFPWQFNVATCGNNN